MAHKEQRDTMRLPNGDDIIVDCRENGEYVWGIPTKGGYYAPKRFMGCHIGAYVDESVVYPITRLVEGEEREEVMTKTFIFTNFKVEKLDYVDMNHKIPGDKYQMRDFTVQVIGNDVVVRVPGNVVIPHHVHDEDVQFRLHNKELVRFNAKRIFIGKGTTYGDCNEYGEDGFDEDAVDGNTILLDLGDRYVYLGWKIVEFHAEKIHTYHSQVGRNDVPCPVAISDNYVYLMSLMQRIPIDQYDPNGSLADWQNLDWCTNQDPYEHLMTSDAFIYYTDHPVNKDLIETIPIIARHEDHWVLRITHD